MFDSSLHQEMGDSIANGQVFYGGKLNENQIDSGLDASNEGSQENDHQWPSQELVFVFKGALEKIVQDYSAATISRIENLPIKTDTELALVFGLVLNAALESPASAQQFSVVVKILSDTFRNPSSAFIRACQGLLLDPPQHPMTNLHEYVNRAELI